MSTIRLTTKRQATFPKSLCDDMGLRKGDVLQVEAATQKGKRIWFLRPTPARDMSWFGRFRRFASGKVHEMQAVRRSIARGRKHAHE